MNERKSAGAKKSHVGTKQPPWGAHFRHTLKVARERAGMTQAQLAQRAGMTQAYVALLEGGRTVPGLENACALARALEVSLDMLMGTAPTQPHVVHYHTPGEVRVWVSNGVVVLGNYGPAEVDKLLDAWQHMRGKWQTRADGLPQESGFPTVEEALGEAPPEGVP